MAIVPDSKNWTWVLEQQCPECGFDASAVAYENIPELIDGDVQAWRDVLARPDVAVRPDDSTWAPLEYAAHVRDVHRIFLRRLTLVCAEDEPSFPNWDQDATAEAENYLAQNPVVVADELADAAHAASAAFAAVPSADRTRGGLRSDGARFSVDTLARYYAHDPIHHLWDVRGR
ncbi:MAG: DinB family protein [Rhodococcus sp. (in: high G+C Gram-positive bacteria)]